MALEYIMVSAGQSCKATICKIRCPAEACIMVEKMLKVVSEAATNAELTMHQNTGLTNGEIIVEYSNKILELVSQPECAGYSVSRAEKN